MNLTSKLTAILLLAAVIAGCQNNAKPGDQMTTTTSMIQLADGSDTPLLTLSNDQLTVQFLPELGGKIVSIKNAAGREFVDRTGRPYARRSYGMEFGKTEFDGIDECFPSMGKCKYPAGPYEEVEIPDHGEVFSSPWEILPGEGVDLACEGTRFPYVFRRQATLDGDTLVLSYTVTNTADEPLHYMYLFHPLLKADKGTKLELPDDMPITISWNFHNFLGERGTVKPWGELTDADGKPFKDEQFIPDTGRYYKYHSPKVDDAELVLRHADGTGVRMTWTRDVLPYFAVWTSEGSTGGLHHFAPEPTNASVDDLLSAHALGQDNVIPPNGTAEWTIRLQLLAP